MTREKAFLAARAAILKDWEIRHPEWAWGKQSDSSVHDMLSVIEGLGLIKFEQPKTVTQEALQRLMTTTVEFSTTQLPEVTGALTHYGAGCIIHSLQAAGLKIVKA